MNRLLTIRGNLLLINLVVVGLILWLAISFLFIAASQRNETMLLQKSMRAGAVMSLAGYALGKERQQFLQYLRSTEESPDPLSADLTTAIANTESVLDSAILQIHELLDREGFVNMIPATRKRVHAQLDEVATNRAQLVQLRETWLAGLDRASVELNTQRMSDLFTAQIDIKRNLADLEKSLKYLPNFDAAAIDTYYSLLNSLSMIKVDLARKSVHVFHSLYHRDRPAQDSGFRTAVLDEKIQERLVDILRLAQTNNRADLLNPLASDVQVNFNQTYSKLAVQVEQDADANSAMAAWSAVNAELTRSIDVLADQTRKSIKNLATRYAARATRNLQIDVFLVVLCFLITWASTSLNRRVKRHAYYDGLTHLANRMNFESSLTNTSVSGNQIHAVIFLDLDRFKAINDNYGHSIGDEVLIEVASRLRRQCKSTDLLARLGGDEFAVFITDVESEAAVEALATRLVESIESIIPVGELNLKVGASAGISLAPQDCECGVELLRNTDIAMYHTKSRKLGSVFRYNQAIAATYQQRLTLEQDLTKGLENGEFALVYQPKVCTRSGQVKSVEALVRWVHPTRGIVPPDQFIPVAEDTGLMAGIGHWVLQQACREIAQLQKSGLSQLQVAVNISPQQFGDEQFVANVCRAVEHNGLSFSSLSVEVTEGIVMNDVDRVIVMLRALQDLGIDIAVDDFGTGYSSLQYLQELPLNTLKIDRAFVNALDDAGADCSVASSIVQLATLFNLETVAEGVETLEQEIMVRSLGVHHIQGYRYSRPVASAELPAVIATIGEQYNSTDWSLYDKAA